MSDLHSRLAANLSAVQARVVVACARAQRDPATVKLVAVVKYAEWNWVKALIDLGVRDLAEARPQQLVERSALLDQEVPHAGVRWHLIGHLQRNKVRPVLPLAHLIHSLDSLRLAERISQIAGELTVRPHVLLEVNVAGETSKDGFTPEQLRRDWSAISSLPHLHVAGLMTMAPEGDDPSDARPTFAGLRDLRDHLASTGTATLDELSMGMSGDFEVAIAEGATLIRVGSRLFEGLPNS